MTIDERLEALTMNLELLFGTAQEQGRHIEELTRNVERMSLNSERDSCEILALTRIAEAHERRLDQLDGGQ